MQLSRAYQKFSVVLQHGTACGVRGGWGDLTGWSITVWQSSAHRSQHFQGIPDLPMSSSAGPEGPVPDDQTLNLPDLSTVLADPTSLDRVEPVPPPPVEPYENYLRRTGCLLTASSSLALQPAAGDVTRDLVTLPLALPRPFLRFGGLALHPRAPVPAPGLGKILPDHCYAPPPDPWKWPGPGPVVPTYPSPLEVPGLPLVHAGSSWTFPDAVAGPPGPRPVMLTLGPAAKSTFSYLLALDPIFSRMPRPLSLDPTPLPIHPDLLAGPPVPSTKLSAAPASAPTHPSSQVTVTPSQVALTPSQVLPVTSQTLLVQNTSLPLSSSIPFRHDQETR